MDKRMIEERLSQLRQEYEAGTQQLRVLEQRKLELQNTMLRISGAIQVLEELSREEPSVETEG